MIHAFELTWTGGIHAPGNSATLQTIAQALPDDQLRVYAEASHIAELKTDRELTEFSTISFHRVPEFSLYRGKTHIVSVRRFIREFGVIWTAIRQGSTKERNLIVLLSATPTAIFAAILTQQLWRGRDIAIQIGLHGNLNDIRGWRSRNPLLRRFDLNNALHAAPGARLRFLVLEDCIKTALSKLSPLAATRTDVLPLPINLNETTQVPTPALALPVKFGYVGLATADKGIDIFLGLAEQAKAKYGSSVEFHLIGALKPGTDITPYTILDTPVSDKKLSREEFVKRLSQIHYVVLPYRSGYYDLSASGALIDAVTWLKPIIATRVPLVEQITAGFGDIGFVCDKADELSPAIDTAMALDEALYDRQRAALTAVRESRSPMNLAVTYRKIAHALYGA